MLLVGYWAIHAAKAARKYLSALTSAGTTPNARFSAAEMAGSAALEWQESGIGAQGECAQQIVELLCNNEAVLLSKPILRARAGDTLARLGDPRFEPQLTPTIRNAKIWKPGTR